MKKIIILFLSIFAASAAQAQTSHRFKLAGFSVGEPSVTEDSLNYSYPVEIVIYEKFINNNYPGKFEQIENATFIISGTKNPRQKDAAIKDSCKAFILKKYPDF